MLRLRGKIKKTYNIYNIFQAVKEMINVMFALTYTDVILV